MGRPRSNDAITEFLDSFQSKAGKAMKTYMLELGNRNDLVSKEKYALLWNLLWKAHHSGFKNTLEKADYLQKELQNPKYQVLEKHSARFNIGQTTASQLINNYVKSLRGQAVPNVSPTLNKRVSTYANAFQAISKGSLDKLEVKVKSIANKAKAFLKPKAKPAPIVEPPQPTLNSEFTKLMDSINSLKTSQTLKPESIEILDRIQTNASILAHADKYDLLEPSLTQLRADFNTVSRGAARATELESIAPQISSFSKFAESKTSEAFTEKLKEEAGIVETPRARR